MCQNNYDIWTFVDYSCHYGYTGCWIIYETAVTIDTPCTLNLKHCELLLPLVSIKLSVFSIGHTCVVVNCDDVTGNYFAAKCTQLSKFSIKNNRQNDWHHAFKPVQIKQKLPNELYQTYVSFGKFQCQLGTNSSNTSGTVWTLNQLKPTLTTQTAQFHRKHT